MNYKKRLYNDFLRPSKEEDYESILKTAKENGYEFHTILSFEDVLTAGIDPKKKYLILRRDIDTADFEILRKFIALERKYGARCSYYFRWSTINVELMKTIVEAGGEASYHYEEIASYCYKHRIRNKEIMLQHIEEIKDVFISDYAKFKTLTAQPCLTIASHGDYVNTKFKYQNTALIDDRVREITGIVREAYDAHLVNALTCRIADQIEMENFTSKVLAAIERGEPVLQLLTHPRQWNSPVWVNLKEEISRFLIGVYMNL